MKSHYRNLHRIGTLSLILAWIVLILGILWTIGIWFGLSQAGRYLQDTFDQGIGPVPVLAALPSFFLVLLAFLQLYVIGKVLHLLVDLEERTATAPVAQPVAAPAEAGTATEISGELNRQSKLIASNLEATQALQQQFTSVLNRLGGAGTSTTAASAAPSTAAPPDVIG